MHSDKCTKLKTTYLTQSQLLTRMVSMKLCTYKIDVATKNSRRGSSIIRQVAGRSRLFTNACSTIAHWQGRAGVCKCIACFLEQNPSTPVWCPAS